MISESGYLILHKKGELVKRCNMLYEIIESCELCPRKCSVNRLKDEVGYCQMGKELVVSSFSPHFGEEKALVGVFGSGTIFLAGCNLLCVYCQNYDISHYRVGRIVSEEEMADFMIILQNKGCHNIKPHYYVYIAPEHYS